MTITDVEITYDITIAKIFYSVYPWSENNLKDAHAGLHSRKNLKNAVRKELTRYRIPELTLN